ncbi:MAG: penicillin-insensitive murein endopeptidase [Deltaproteobacteria bacterium]|nr:penicillin-insensitive murein endopeptidase [Deltaproteobacteria bacterium]
MNRFSWAWVASIAVLACGGQGSPAPSEDEPERHAEPEPVEREDDAPPEERAEAPEGEDEAEPERATCEVPAIPIPRPRECVRGRGYPDCKWQMPHATLSDGRYRRWRNTIMEHWWGRPALVSFVMAAAHRYHERFPDQVLAVGDLDAPGPRHQTHDNGVDVDIYLPGAMIVENAGGGAYPSNHEGKSPEEIEATRQRVEGLARELATCANGAVRIYYNDDVVLERFHEWYDAQGFDENPFGRPMQKHNHLHDFHFHITIPEDLAVLPRAPLAAGESDPIQIIEAPPDPNSAPNLASRNRNTTWMGGEPEEDSPLDEAADPMSPPSAMTPSAMAPSAMSAEPTTTPSGTARSGTATATPTMAPAAREPATMSATPEPTSAMAPSAPSAEQARRDGDTTATGG